MQDAAVPALLQAKCWAPSFWIPVGQSRPFSYSLHCAWTLLHTLCPMKILPFFFCPGKNLTPLSSGHPSACLDLLSWIKRYFFVYSWTFRSLLTVRAHKLCQSKSAPFCCSCLSWKDHRVVIRNPSSVFSWGKERGKVMLSVSFGTKKKKSHEVIFYMDREIFWQENGSDKVCFGVRLLG